MNKNMKSYFISLVVFLLAATQLTACGDTASTTLAALTLIETLESSGSSGAAPGTTPGAPGGNQGIPTKPVWTFEDILLGADVGKSPKIAVDVTGIPHVISLNTSLGIDSYQYSVRTGITQETPWTSSPVASARPPIGVPGCSDNVGEISDIAIDANNLPHMSLEVPDKAIRYATASGVQDISTSLCNPFQGASVDESWVFVGDNSIAVDPNTNTTWIVAKLANATANDVKAFRYWKTGDTGTTEIDRQLSPANPVPVESPTGVSVGSSPSIAIDNLGNAHVSYEQLKGDTTTNDLIKYAKWNGTTFVTEIVADVVTANFGWGTSLAVDSGDQPHIIYYHSGQGYKHAHFNGTTWILELATNNIAAPGTAWMDIDIDAADNLHVVYSTLGEVRYTKKSRADGTWSAPVTLSTTGERPAISVDTTGGAHVVMRDAINGKLTYARLLP